MTNKFYNIKERALHVAKNKGISKEFFCESIGMSYGSFKGSARERPLNSDAIKNLLSTYSDINAEWLILGKGNMIKHFQEDNIFENEIKFKFSKGDGFDFFGRLDIFMKFKGLNDNKISVEAGISNGLIGKARKRGGLSLENVSKILYTYPEIDANWLLRGCGYMLK